jgi:hypothetical protein
MRATVAAAIAQVALGVTDPGCAKPVLDEACSRAKQTSSIVFQEGVDDVRDGRTTGHMLSAFVKRCRDQRAEVWALHRIGISLVEGTVSGRGPLYSAERARIRAPVFWCCGRKAKPNAPALP